MKAKKALRKLNHAETLLAEVAEKFTGAGEAVLTTIAAAQQTVTKARTNIESLRVAESPLADATTVVSKKGAGAATGRRAMKAKTA